MTLVWYLEGSFAIPCADYIPWCSCCGMTGILTFVVHASARLYLRCLVLFSPLIDHERVWIK